MEPKMNSFEVAALMAFVKHYMPMEMRHAMMKSLPEVYNKMCGTKVVATVLDTDRDDVNVKEV